MSTPLKISLILAVAISISCSDNESTNQTAADGNANVVTTATNCVDLISENSDWSDNCVLSTENPYANSTYLLGVQRILWCVDAFVDSTLNIEQVSAGEYSHITKEAVLRYQNRHSLPNSGMVDAKTWSQFQRELVLVGAAAAEYSSFAIAGNRCNNEIHFYQRNTEPLDWKIAAQPNSNELLDFSGLPVQQ